jgi:hypothetical protein
LRGVHDAVGAVERTCLSHVWVCALTRKRGRWLHLSEAILLGEGAALVVAKGCPLGYLQRRVGDDVPMFELWFGPKLARFAVPFFSGVAALGLLLCIARPARA